MTDHERQRDAQSGGPADGVEPTGAQVPSLRPTGEGFLSAADHAIDRALSGNSEAFLNANRQQGGQ